MLRNCLSALLNSLTSNVSGEKVSRKIKRQKAVSYSRSLRFEPCEDRTMLSVSPFNSEDVTAHWTFNSDTEDTNGAFIGTLNNGASLTSDGIVGGGLSLDGVDDYFSIGDPEELQILDEITLTAWIVPESASGVQNIIAKGYSTNPRGEIFLRIANGKYQVGSWNGSNHIAEFAIPSSDIGERVHLAGTYDGTTWRLYRNGVEIASTVDSIGAVEVDGAWAVGARGTGTERFFNGVIDEVVISSTVYTAQEIAALASIPTNAQEDNSVTWNWSDVQSGELYSEQGDSLGTFSNGAVVQFDSDYGQVLNLSGNSGYVSLGNPDDLQIHGEITLSAWICPNSLNGVQNIIAKGHSSNPNGEIFLRIANGEYQVGSWNGDNYYASAVADTDDIGQWIQLTGVYDGTAWRLYKNGVLTASLSSTVGAVPVNANWSIGSNGSGSARFFNGKIGCGGIYDHALDAQAVAALMSDSQTIARVGGNPYAIKDLSYVLQLDASSPGVLWTINWGDGTTEELYNVTSASHIYTYSGTSGVNVTAKRNGRAIDVQGSSIGLQIGSVDEMIINGNFENVAIPNGTYWAIYNSIPGWSGQIEIQEKNGSKVAELDTDSRYSDLDPSESDHQPHHTSISSSPLSFTPGLTYTLSFDAWNRSDYAQDNILNVTVPGEIISVNGNTPVSTLLDLIDEDDLGAFSFTSISYNSVTFSAGGSYYETDDGNGGTVYTLGVSPFHVSSITFVATSDYGYVSFSDVSTDVVPCYGPYLDNISLNQEYLYVDIDVDSNNDGVINDFDDTIEMTKAVTLLPGETFQAFTNVITSFNLSPSLYGVRTVSSNALIAASQELEYLNGSILTYTAGMTAGTATLTYELYYKPTNSVVASDSVLVTVNHVYIDMDINSENLYYNFGNCNEHLESQTILPSRSDFEDEIEDDPSYLGKLIVPNWGDIDNDGILDCYDGFAFNDNYAQANPNSSAKFVPIVVEIPSCLDVASTYIAFSFLDFSPFTTVAATNGLGNKPIGAQFPTGSIRLWTADGNTTRSGQEVSFGDFDDYTKGNLIKSQVRYKLSDLGFTNSDNGNVITLYVEGCTQNGHVETLKSIDTYGRPLSSITVSLYLPNQEEAYCSDTVKYVVANTDAFIYKLAHSQDLRCLLASQFAYSSTNRIENNFCLERYTDSKLLEFVNSVQTSLEANSNSNNGEYVNLINDIYTSFSNDENSGYSVSIFRDKISGKIIFAFRGSEDWADYIADVVNAVGFQTEQYHNATKLGKALALMSDSQSFILTGHSLGGGLASTAYVAAHSLGKNIKTYTFNAAGVSSNALSNYNLSIPVSISDIKAYYLDWDILSYSQYMLSSIPCALGTQIEIDGPYDSSITTEIAIYVLGVLVEDPAICLAGNILAFNTMLAAHGIESLLYGFLATENIFTSNIDAYGYEI